MLFNVERPIASWQPGCRLPTRLAIGQFDGK
jgi:hypothetical protein